MTDWMLLLRTVRAHGGIFFLAVLLFMAGGALLYLPLLPDSASRPAWLGAMAPGAWWILGFICILAGLTGLGLCWILMLRSYQGELVRRHGMIRSARVTGKELEEIPLRTWLGRKRARVLRLGRIFYEYQVDGQVRQGRFDLSDSEYPLFQRIALGDSIPVRVPPRPPWRATPHRPRLYQQYDWVEPRRQTSRLSPWSGRPT